LSGNSDKKQGQISEASMPLTPCRTIPVVASFDRESFTALTISRPPFEDCHTSLSLFSSATTRIVPMSSMNPSRLRGYRCTTARRQQALPRTRTKTMIARPLAALRRWMRDRSNLRVLAALDDHLLDDIGLARADIRPIASRRFSRWYRM
jgi:uncharacterized protein YjiS (DUF1127 family)